MLLKGTFLHDAPRWTLVWFHFGGVPVFTDGEGVGLGLGVGSSKMPTESL